MKASEMIKELTVLLTRHGDLDVTVLTQIHNPWFEWQDYYQPVVDPYVVGVEQEHGSMFVNQDIEAMFVIRYGKEGRRIK